MTTTILPETQQTLEFKKLKNSSSPVISKTKQIVLSISGQEATGKSYLSLTSVFKGPVVYFNFDLNEAGAMGKFQDYQDQIIHFKYEPRLIEDHEGTRQTFLRFFNPNDGEYNQAISLPKSKNGTYTFIIDTATALQDLVQDYELYQPEAIRRRNTRSTGSDPQPLDYKTANNKFQYILNQIKLTPHNLIMVHRASRLWVRNERGQREASDIFVPDQHDSERYLVSLEVWLEKARKSKFNNITCEIRKCSFFPKLEGAKFPTSIVDFGFLRGITYNDTSDFSEEQMKWWARCVRDGRYEDLSTGEMKLTPDQEKDFNKWVSKVIDEDDVTNEQKPL